MLTFCIDVVGVIYGLINGYADKNHRVPCQLLATFINFVPKTIARILGAMADKHGPIFMFRFGTKPALVISSLEAVKECFTTNDRVFAARPTSSQGKYLGYNCAGFGFSPYGSYWSKMRKLAVSELLSSSRLEKLKNMPVSEVDTLVKDLYSVCRSNEDNPVRVVISEWIEGLALNIIIKVIARKRYFGYVNGGSDGEAKRIGEIVKEFMYLVGAPIMFDLIPFLRWIDLQGQVKSMKCVAELDSLIGSWVEEHIARMLKVLVKLVVGNAFLRLVDLRGSLCAYVNGVAERPIEQTFCLPSFESQSGSIKLNNYLTWRLVCKIHALLKTCFALHQPSGSTCIKEAWWLRVLKILLMSKLVLSFEREFVILSTEKRRKKKDIASPLSS